MFAHSTLTDGLITDARIEYLLASVSDGQAKLRCKECQWIEKKEFKMHTRRLLPILLVVEFHSA